MIDLTHRAMDGLSALRSVALVLMALVTASAFYRLGTPMLDGQGCAAARNRGLSDIALKWVHVERSGATLPIGAHLISPRGFYLHHGIYLGDLKVAHYSGFSGSLRSGPIEVIDLEHFAHGKPVWIAQEPYEFSNDEVVRRALSRIGENRYRILSNNCEHFCNWCISGKHYSAQVDAYFQRPRDLFALISTLEPQLIA
ncbi:lecithin retinol acyltransferase family protein [Pseudomonas sp. SWRI179]|uniref:lecithin retinol acyltransferase family protein n=1 Tax=Pseudomonas sp. SWRI179 TaxID=2745497 RepID=UPI0016488CFF|nr:lecithin retinol acyltransferase family protein [Pseudomonas sp. SWRI179]MBC3385478.1 lecithin retinol acyltransferase family protein [Pseudomonas sp. SWRI179]